MKSSKEIIKAAGIIPKLKLGIKTGKGVQSTGPHRVRFIADKEVEGVDADTGKPIAVVAYLVEENGEKKSYRVPKFNKKTNEVHYLILRLADVAEGTEVILEMKRRGARNYIEVIPVTAGVNAELSDDEVDDEAGPVAPTPDGDIPIIQADDEPLGDEPGIGS